MTPDAIPIRVGRLVVPDLLAELQRDGSWPQVGQAVVTRTMPWFADPLDFLSDLEEMERESQTYASLQQDEEMARVFRLAQGTPILSLLDMDQAVLIAVAHYAGDETAIALDYRTSPADPRVVATDVWTDPANCKWRAVADTFAAFVAAAGR